MMDDTNFMLQRWKADQQIRELQSRNATLLNQLRFINHRVQRLKQQRDDLVQTCRELLSYLPDTVLAERTRILFY